MAKRRRRLPVQPLAATLAHAYMQWRDDNTPAGARDLGRAPGLATYAAHIGEHERHLRHILRYQERVNLATADRLCVKLGIHLNEVYP